MFNEYEKFHLRQREAPEEIKQTFKALFTAHQHTLFDAAVSAEKRARHHSKVDIGCSMLILNKDFDPSHLEMVTGANTKKQKGMLAWPKRECAEMRALLNALNITRQDEIQNQNWGGVDMEPGRLEEGGVVAAVLTVSESRNTGEADRINHDVLQSCNQCIFNYEGLLKMGIVAKDTIIYNARIKNDKQIAFQKQTLAELLQKFHEREEVEKRNERSIADVVQVRDTAVAEYQERFLQIKAKLGDPKKVPIPPIMPTNEVIQDQLDRQRERVEDMYEAMDDCARTIFMAMKSALEEGVPKTRIIEELGLGGIRFDVNTAQFSPKEEQLCIEGYKEILAADSKIES